MILMHVGFLVLTHASKDILSIGNKMCQDIRADGLLRVVANAAFRIYMGFNDQAIGAVCHSGQSGMRNVDRASYGV